MLQSEPKDLIIIKVQDIAWWLFSRWYKDGQK